MRIADLRLADVTGADWTDTDQAKVIWTEEDLWDDALGMNVVLRNGRRAGEERGLKVEKRVKE